MAKSTRPKILVLGSLGRSTMLVPFKADSKVFLRKEGWVGAPLLREMICQSLVELQDDLKSPITETDRRVASALDEIRRRVLPAPPELKLGGLHDVCVKITSVFKQLNKTSNPKDRTAVLRVASHYTSLADKPEELKQLLTWQMNAAVAACRDPDVLVLFDFDEVSRGLAQSSLRGLRAGAGRRFTVLGFAGEIRGNALNWLRSLTRDVTGGPDRTVAVVRAEELRKAGLIIIESGPIERTVRDLFQYFKHPPLSIMVGQARHLVILFEEVGAVYVKLGASREGSIHLSSNSDAIRCLLTGVVFMVGSRIEQPKATDRETASAQPRHPWIRRCRRAVGECSRGFLRAECDRGARTRDRQARTRDRSARGCDARHPGVVRASLSHRRVRQLLPAEATRRLPSQ